MATYRTSPIGVIASGSIGNFTLRPLQSHGVVSAKRSRLRRDDGLVGFDLQANKAASDAWKNLSAENRGFWEVMADDYQTGFGFSAPTNQSAHSLYFRTARCLLEAGGPFPPTFPIYQIQGRRQGIPAMFPRTADGEWHVRWAPGLQGEWGPNEVWLRARATAVSQPSRKRPAKTYTRTYHVPAASIPLAFGGASAVLDGFDFEFDRGWVRWEFTSWDRWGWFSNPRSIIYPVLPQAETWFLTYGPNIVGEPNGFLTVTDDEITVKWENEFATFDQTETLGPGGLVTAGDVAEWLDEMAFMRLIPMDADDLTADALTVRRVPTATMNVRGNPVSLRFGFD